MVKKKKKKVIDVAEKEALDDEVMVERGGVEVPVDQPVEDQPVAEVEVRNKPVDWEPHYIHVQVEHILYATVAPDKGNWKVTVGFDNEADANKFHGMVEAHVVPSEGTDL